MPINMKWLSLLALGAIAVTALYLWQDDAVTPAQADIKTTKISRETLTREVIATGVIRPIVGAEINIGSRVSGIVEDLPVKVGDTVEAGQLLAQIDSTPFEALVAQAEADVQVSRAEIALAESTVKRKQNLAADGYSSEADLDEAIRDLNVGRARLALNQAKLRSANINLGYSRITAPIKGVIADVTTREGETVAANFVAPTFVSIVDLDRLEVQAYVDETDIGRVFVGQKARFKVDTYSDTDFEATVTAINPKAELQNSVVNYIVVLDFEGQAGRVLRPEMTAHVRLRMEERHNVLTVPRSALRRQNGLPTVVVERDGDWTEQPVRVGWRTDQRVEIVDGVREGEVIQLNPS
jgi:RND family efflux transporter MFP subunit